MSNNPNSVRDFFDDHAPEYQTKYDGQNRFYKYFFYERLEKATESIDVTGKSILDIGAGTGPLYDHLLRSKMDDFKRYIATDISEGMLRTSKVPKEQQRIGDFVQMDFEESFDFIFMLGVSTYIEPEMMGKYIEKLESLLSPGGALIITFTNRHSLDIKVRSWFNPLGKLIAGKNRVMSQDFETWYYSKKEVKIMFSEYLFVDRIRGLNHTIFPISRLFPVFSIFLAKKVFSHSSGRLKRLLSSDLLVFAEKK